MLTIVGTYRTRLVLGIPNNNVRKQYYEYLLEEYQSHQSIDLNKLTDLCGDMAYDGHWREALVFIAHAYVENSSVRSGIEGERNIQGFFTAYLSLNVYYLLAPELELNHGFCDLFLMPDLQRYNDVAHSYILELKYLSVKDFDSKAESQWGGSCGTDKRLCHCSSCPPTDTGNTIALYCYAISGMGIDEDGRSTLYFF